MISTENEFSQLKGVNKQSYLDFEAYAIPLTKRCLFFLLQYQEELFNDRYYGMVTVNFTMGVWL